MGRFAVTRRLGTALLIMTLVAPGLVTVAPAVEASSGLPVSYSYDPLGRLRSTVTDTDAAIYSYDASGNITAIGRQSASTPALFEFAPRSGAIGTPVTLHGTGFGPTASQNTVRFNGVLASITEASPTRLTVTTPQGANDGPIIVESPNGTATSAVDFIVEVGGPVIASFDPAVAARGDTVTISG